MLKKQVVEIQLSQQRLFHLTMCPCVNGNVNSGQSQAQSEKTAGGHVCTQISMCCVFHYKYTTRNKSNSVNSTVIKRHHKTYT